MAWNVNNDLVLGNEMFLYITLPDSSTGEISDQPSASTIIAYATSCSLQVDAETIDVSSKFSCRWNSVRQGNASYTISADALYCLQSAATANDAYTIDDLFEAMVDGKNVGWFIGQDAGSCDSGEYSVGGLDTSKPFYYGEAAITSLSIEAGNNEIVSSSISLTGSGKINQGGVS